MVYLLYGANDFSLREALASLKESVRPAELRDVNVTVLDGSGVSFGELTAACDTVPFLAEKRLIIVEGLLSLFDTVGQSRGRSRAASERTPTLGQWEELSDYLAKVPATTDLAFVDGPLDRSNPLLARIRSRATVWSFPLPGPGEIVQWIGRRAESKGMHVEPAAIRALADSVGGNLQALDGELEKLSAYRMDQPVRRSDVEELVSYTKEANIFAAVDAMIEGRRGVAIRLAHQLIDAGRPVAYLLAMVSRQVRLLLLAKDLKGRGLSSAEIGRRLRLSEYPLKKTLQQERRLNADQLARIHRGLLEADLRIKTGRAEEDLVLDMLIAEISSIAAPGGKAATAARGR